MLPISNWQGMHVAVLLQDILRMSVKDCIAKYRVYLNEVAVVNLS